MADVFISYHRSEGASALVRRIARELESMDISCWYDTKDPTPGRFADTIEKEIQLCKAFLFLWDNGANQSDWCCDEAFAALEHQKTLIPFQVGQFEKRDGLSLRLRGLNIFYGGDSPENADIERLIATVKAALLDKKPAEIEKPSAKLIKSGSCGDNVTYALYENGALTISGNGKMDDTFLEDSFMSGFVQTIRIQEGVTCIRGFENYSALKSVTIPSSLTDMGDDVFADCYHLESVAISDGVTYIAPYAFMNCWELTSVTLPDSVSYIAPCAFVNCLGLTSVIIPDSVDGIGDSAFFGCVSLESVVISNGIIGCESFYGCDSLESLTISDGVTTLGAKAFEGCGSLTSVYIPDSVDFLGMDAFGNCESLKYASVPKDMDEDMAYEAFDDTVEILWRE